MSGVLSPGQPPVAGVHQSPGVPRHEGLEAAGNEVLLAARVAQGVRDHQLQADASCKRQAHLDQPLVQPLPAGARRHPGAAEIAGAWRRTGGQPCEPQWTLFGANGEPPLRGGEEFGVEFARTKALQVQPRESVAGLRPIEIDAADALRRRQRASARPGETANAGAAGRRSSTGGEKRQGVFAFPPRASGVPA